MSDLWDKVIDNAQAARLMFTHRHYNVATGRAYYAMFTAARVLLKEIVDIDLEATRRHSVVLRLFSKHFVKEGAFGSEFGRVLNRSSQTRAVADYSTTFVSEEEASDLIAVMETFIATAERILSEHRAK